MKFDNRLKYQKVQLRIPSKMAKRIMFAAKRTGITEEEWIIDRINGQLSRFTHDFMIRGL